MFPNYRYLKRILLNAHFLIGVHWLGINCQIKHVEYKISLALNLRYLKI